MLTIGEILKKAREAKGYSLKDIQKDTRIRAKYLEAVEKNDWTEFPSKTYISGIIRNYSKYLDIPPEKAIAYFRRDYEKRDDVKFRRRIGSLDILPETKKIVIGVIAFICLFFFSYFGYQIYLFYSPPEITLTSPKEKVFRNVERIRIVGVTDPDAVVTIFNREVYPDDNGVFRYDLPLSKGQNPIRITVTGANGRTSEIREVYVLE